LNVLANTIDVIKVFKILHNTEWPN